MDQWAPIWLWWRYDMKGWRSWQQRWIILKSFTLFLSPSTWYFLLFSRVQYTHYYVQGRALYILGLLCGWFRHGVSSSRCVWWCCRLYSPEAVDAATYQLKEKSTAAAELLLMCWCWCWLLLLVLTIAVLVLTFNTQTTTIFCFSLLTSYIY